MDKNVEILYLSIAPRNREEEIKDKKSKNEKLSIVPPNTCTKTIDKI